MICTFYSYKGGVGRSMALANIAELLYARGLRVLMVDFDLEAPGLERYFNVANAQTKPRDALMKRGVMDMLTSYLELRALPRIDTPEDFHGGALPMGSFPFPVEPLTEFIVPIYSENSSGGRLDLIPAGRRSGTDFAAYAHRVRSFNWDDFYATWDAEAFF